MNPLLRFAGPTAAFARYQPAGVGALRHLPATQVGIAHYSLDEMRTLDHAQVVERAAAIGAELETLDAATDWSDEQRATFDTLTAELDALGNRRTDLARRAEVRRVAVDIAGAAEVAVPTIIRRTDDPFDPNTLRMYAPAAELRSRATAAIERTVAAGDGVLTPAMAEAITAKMRTAKDPRGVIPGLVLHTGHEDYQRAFAKGLAGRTDLWTDAERQAVQRVEEFRAAMSLTDANGGYAVPFTLDPSLIFTGDGSTNPFRQVCRVVTITTDTWNGLSSSGVTASWDGEIAEVSDDSPTFAQPSAATKRGQAFAQGSIEIAADYRAIAGDLQGLFQQAKDDLEAAAFATGATGGNNPAGIVPLVVAFGAGSSIKTSAGADTFAVADVYATQNQTPPANRPRSVWFANNATINLMRQFGTANNYHGFLVDLGAGQPAQLLGQPLYESSAMDGVITGAAENYMLLHGQPDQFLIADRVGMSVEFIPHLFNTANNLPDGRRGWYCYWRVGTALLNGNAFTILNVT